MAILSKLKKTVAAYHQVATSALTVDSEDLFLVAANNAKNNAQLLHNFELSRCSATLSIDGETGGALSDAVFLDDTLALSTVTVTGTLTPNATGTYTSRGTYNGKPLFIHENENYILFWDFISVWTLQASTGGLIIQADCWSLSSDATSPNGTYIAGGSYTGSAVVSGGVASSWSAIKEVLAVRRTNVDGLLVPLDFTRADIAIERDRYELEMDEDYAPSRRYPSDAQLLQRGSNGSIVQRGNKLFVYPLDTITTSPLDVTLECYADLADYTTANLSDTEPTDFLLRYGGAFMQWSIICELNYLFQTFVPRQEGSLTMPERERENAWRNLLLWDTYMVDANTTRSR